MIDYCIKFFTQHFYIIVGILTTVIISPFAMAELIPQGVLGIVDTADEITQEWLPLDETIDVIPGNIVRTDFQAATDLLGNDGSFFNLGEVTEFLVREYDYQPDNEVRIVQCSILEGLVTADAMHLDYATNIFDIETPTVIASFKFSKATFNVAKNGDTEVKLHNGKFELVGLKGSNGSTRTTHVAEDGTETELSFSADGAISAETTDSGLNIGNIGKSPITMSVGGQSVELTPGASIETTVGEDGKPVIQNTSQNSQAEVTIGGVKIGAGGSLSLTLGGSQTTPSTSSTTPAATGATTTFQTINQGSTSSSVPSSMPSSTGGTASGGTTPGERPPERRPVALPIKVIEK